MKNKIVDYISASLLLLVISFIWLSLIVIKSYILIPVTIIANFKYQSTIFNTPVYWKHWAWQMWLADDQNVNSVLGGDRDITISSRVGYKSQEGNSIASIMEYVIDWIFFLAVGEIGHCKNSLERDETHTKHWGK